jgi:hypothetical protein
MSNVFYDRRNVGHEITLTTPEKYALISALCDKLKWERGYGATRVEMLATAMRITEIVASLPDDDGDAA